MTVNVPSFNLVDEAWIPITDVAGDSRECGLREVLVGAAGIAAVASGSGLIDAAVMRLLLAITAAADGAPEVWLSAHHRDFDLFDRRRPFAQNADMWNYLNTAGTTNLPTTLATANYSVISTVHDTRFEVTSMSPADAALNLLMRQAFSTVGIQSFPKQIYRGGTASASICTVRPFVYLTAATLADTLAVNMPLEFGSSGRFAFTWDEDEVPFSIQRAGGVIDALTWLSRSMLLVPNDSGTEVVAYMCTDGRRYRDTDPRLVPHTTYQRRRLLPNSPEMRAELRAWVAEHGDANVPADAVGATGLPLGWWCHDRRVEWATDQAARADDSGDGAGAPLMPDALAQFLSGLVGWQWSPPVPDPVVVDWEPRNVFLARPGWLQLLGAYAERSPGILGHQDARVTGIRIIGYGAKQARIDGYVDEMLPAPQITPEQAGELLDAISVGGKKVADSLRVAGAALGVKTFLTARSDGYRTARLAAARTIVEQAVSGQLPIGEAVAALSVPAAVLGQVITDLTAISPAAAGVAAARLAKDLP